MASATRQARGRNPPAPAPAPPPASPSIRSSLSEAGDSNAGEDDAANTPAPNPVVTINVADLQAIQQRIADLEAAQHNPRRRRRSESESDHEPAPKRTHLKGKSPEEYWGENHQKLDAFIRQCEKNFKIDGCTTDETRVAYASSFIRGTPEKEWDEYADREEHQEPHIITWTDMKKELRRQLGEEHVYVDQMYEKWQRATQRSGQTGKEYGAYLQSIRTTLRDLGEGDFLNEKILIHHMRQGLRSEVRAALYRNPSIPTDWPSFLAAVARAESSLYQEHKSSFHAKKSPTSNKEKPVDKVTEPGLSSSNSHRNTNFRGNSHAQSRGRGGHGVRAGRGGYRGGRVSNGTPASGTNNTKPSNLSDHSKDTCFNCNKVGHWSNECPDPAPKN